MAKNVEPTPVVATPDAGGDAPKKEKIYWAPPKRFQLANYIPEQRTDKRVLQREVPIRFEEHLYVTSDPKKIEYIEASGSFEAGTIKLCATMADANALTARQGAMKTIRTLESSVVERTEIQDKP